jgi:hypothetical protein
VKRNPEVPLSFGDKMPLIQKNLEIVIITQNISKRPENIRNDFVGLDYPGKGAENFLMPVAG